MQIVWMLLAAAVAQSQPTVENPASSPDEFRVYSEPPRLFLTGRRARLITRERERDSMRWRNFQQFMAGKAQMPEPGLAHALHYKITGDTASLRAAAEFALSPAADVRQQAIVYDWCAPSLPKPQSDALAARLVRAAEQTPRPADIAAVSARLLAALAIADAKPDLAERVLHWTVVDWWRGRIAPELKRGVPVVKRDDMLALYELLHAVRDNTNIELRDSALPFFKNVPAYQLLTYYPTPWPAPENEYRIPVYYDDSEPDLRRASLSRAAEYLMVAYDNNALESQFLQGWLLQDRFLMQSPLGVVYEMLWANPYQPGLSYFHMPLQFHDEKRQGGALMLRSSWEEEALWFSYLDRKAQWFEGGKRKSVDLAKLDKPLVVGEAAVLASLRFDAELETYFLVGLKPGGVYEVEVDDEEMREGVADAGGILELKFLKGFKSGVRVRLATVTRPS